MSIDRECVLVDRAIDANRMLNDVDENHRKYSFHIVFVFVHTIVYENHIQVEHNLNMIEENQRTYHRMYLYKYLMLIDDVSVDRVYVAHNQVDVKQ